MAEPSDLISHYSSKIFQTRIYALTLAGAVLGGAMKWFPGDVESGVAGLVLILVVGSLAESNRRYTHSYLCSCYASSRSAWKDPARWYLFMRINEEPWSGRKVGAIISRVGLYWATFLPGLAGGLYLIWRNKIGGVAGETCGAEVAMWARCTWTAVGVLVLGWLIYGAVKPPHPKDYFRRIIRGEIGKFEEELAEEGRKLEPPKQAPKLQASEDAIDHVINKGFEVEVSAGAVEKAAEKYITLPLKREIDKGKFEGKETIKIDLDKEEHIKFE
ncbi:MAG: hypothetical protein JSV99_11285 [Planctomycetota bacterium]|nr:MAG: hypothetical protein JSV99_11285 [Planctomycetota bacterium]